MSVALEIHNLTKTYGRRNDRKSVLNGLDLRVETSEVHGLLGANGSGKSTTFRIILGLVRASSGTISICGSSGPLPDQKRKHLIGAALESPRFLGQLSGTQNLQLLARAAGLSSQVVGESLEITGLHDASRQRFQTYSLGMKQRLSVAAALMGKPNILLLDEPTNGLDPDAIRQLRSSILNARDTGVTTVLTSHDLNEVQMLCSHVSILREGRRVLVGAVSSLTSAAGDAIWLKSPDLAAARQSLEIRGFTAVFDDVSGRLRVAADAAQVASALDSANVVWTEIVPAGESLEAIYLRASSEQVRGPAGLAE